MSLELNRSELERLLELATLGDWLINGHRPIEERAATHDASLQKLLALAEEEGLGYLVSTEEETGSLKPSEALMARLALAGHVADYDDCVFWDELAIRLAERDLRAELGAAVFDALPPHERHERVDALAQTYDHEFDMRGVDRLQIDRARRARVVRDGLTERLLKLFDDNEKK
jgi:hypothetical protein